MAYTYFDDIGAWEKRRLLSPEREHEIEAEQRKAGLSPEPAWGD